MKWGITQPDVLFSFCSKMRMAKIYITICKNQKVKCRESTKKQSGGIKKEKSQIQVDHPRCYNVENWSRYNVVNTTLGAYSFAAWVFQELYKRVGIYLYFKAQSVMNNDKNKSYNVRTIEANRLQNPCHLAGYILIWLYAPHSLSYVAISYTVRKTYIVRH